MTLAKKIHKRLAMNRREDPHQPSCIDQPKEKTRAE